MSEQAGDDKNAIRKRMLEWRSGLDESEWRERSESICERLRTEFVRDHQSIMVFATKDREVNLLPLLETLPEDATVCLPATDPTNGELEIYTVDVPDHLRQSLANERPAKSLVRGAHDIIEPCPETNAPFDPAELDLVVVPGLAFDGEGNRIGYGEGYYDKFLAGLDDTITTVGICFDEQLTAEPLPVDDHDVPVKRVVTDRRMK